MNIFSIHQSPVQSARELHDKHVVKMILESTQMLANALGDLHGSGLTPILTKRFVAKGKLRFHFNTWLHPQLITYLLMEQYVSGRIFGWDSLGRLQFSTKGYASHPCTVWVRKSETNLRWLLTHSLALACEYRQRYGRTHSLHAELNRLVGLIPNLSDWRKASEFPRAMPDVLKNDKSISTHEAYRLYLKNHKPWYYKGWKRSSPPAWLTS